MPHTAGHCHSASNEHCVKPKNKTTYSLDLQQSQLSLSCEIFKMKLFCSFLSFSLFSFPPNSFPEFLFPCSSLHFFSPLLPLTLCTLPSLSPPFLILPLLTSSLLLLWSMAAALSYSSLEEGGGPRSLGGSSSCCNCAASAWLCVCVCAVNKWRTMKII